ncbi:DUF5713 family protein [Xylella taiwanensis]|uniref:DUF5713 family protein n=1 Tax=Xylella taiwanensis TaxID=1444770 RepID=UPI001E2B6B93|nr:DUF5713 family protein [Xylella taiwanensis]UFS49771.1 DUF5713 family protein [Xylella taiwanensis]
MHAIFKPTLSPAAPTPPREPPVPIQDEQVRHYPFLSEMYADPYFPNGLVDRARGILIRLCEQIEAQRPADLDGLYVLTHEATEEFNALTLVFEQHGSAIETVARNCIAADFAFIAKAYGYQAETEAMIENSDW